MTQRSRGVVLREFREPLVVEEVEVPAPRPGAIVVQVTYGGICGTDVHLCHGRLPMALPVLLGHEGVGVVRALGDGVESDFLGAPLHEGDVVAWASNIPCGKCYWCVAKGERTLCPNRQVYGITRRFDEWPQLSGGWADYIYLQPGTTLVRLPEGVTPEDAISLGCAGPTAVHGVVHRTGIELGDVVVVQGSGPVGLASAMYAHVTGARKVILVGGPAGRLELAREAGVGDMHIDIFELSDPAERVRRVLAETDGARGADVVLECTGVPASVPEGLEMARRGGKYLVLGHYTDSGSVPLNPHVITRKQLQVLGSWAFAESHYVEYIQSLPQLRARFDLGRLLTVYPLEEANQALAAVAAGEVMKGVLRPRP
ncbi:MAG: zinc-binding dehydrogenase [Chloroflexota bacterium]|nr:zinc-binding dehydrogenase [Chloroflexota bacterium]